MIAILRPPTLNGVLPDQAEDYTTEMYNAILQLDSRQSQLQTLLNQVKAAIPAAAPSATPTAPATHLVTSFSLIGPPFATVTWTVRHNLGTKAVIASVQHTSGLVVSPVVIGIVDENNVAFTGTAVFAANAYRAVVLG